MNTQPDLFTPEQIGAIDRALVIALKNREGIPDALLEAMGYSLVAPGKRFRAMLCLKVGSLLGLDDEEVMPLATAIEFIHTYSLIHDDLPAMDDDDVRRGQPSNHRVYGEGMAILAGDALLTEAFAIVAGEQNVRNPDRSGELCRRLSVAAGPAGMVGGQVLDIRAEPEIDVTALNRIHGSKTSSLMSFATSAPAIVSDDPEGVREALSSFGFELGIAFQIIDDILDETGQSERTGKPAGSDRERDKTTYVSLLGIEASRYAARARVDSALAALNRAVEDLERQAVEPALEILGEMTRYCIERDK